MENQFDYNNTENNYSGGEQQHNPQGSFSYENNNNNYNNPYTQNYQYTQNGGNYYGNYSRPGYAGFNTRKNVVRDPFVGNEAKHIKKLGILAGAGVLGLLFVQYFLSFMLRIEGLADLYSSNYVFSLAVGTIISIFSVFIPFRIVYACYSKGDKEKCYDFGKPVSAKAFLYAVFAGLMVCCIGDFVTDGFSGFVSCFGVQFKDISSQSPKNFTEFLMFTLECAVVPALVEEYAIRGVVMQPLRKYGDRFAIVMSSVIFAFMHGNMIQIPFAFVAGLALGYFAISTKSIWTSVVIHFLNNFFAVVTTFVSGNTAFGSAFFLLSMAVIIGVGVYCLIQFVKTEHYGLGFTVAPKEDKLFLCIAVGIFIFTSLVYSLKILRFFVFYVGAFIALVFFFSMYKNANRKMLNKAPATGIPLKTMVALYTATPTVILSLYFLMLETALMVDTSDSGGVFFVAVIYMLSLVVSIISLYKVCRSDILENKNAYTASIIILCVIGFLTMIYLLLSGASVIVR